MIVLANKALDAAVKSGALDACYGAVKWIKSGVRDGPDMFSGSVF